jgi:hypothetical protein
MLCFKATSILMHDVWNNITPPNISNQFIYSNINHKHNTRSSFRDNYFIKLTKLQKQKNSFLCVGARIRNTLPINFSNFYDHTNPLFIKLELLKFPDLIYLHTAL